MERHVILVGIPGAGKSSVGRLVAQILGVELFDIDELIEKSEGKSAGGIIEDRGEREFRRLEKLETDRALLKPFAVIAPGGGWAAEADNIDRLPDQSLTIFLDTAPHVAAARLGGNSGRPLLNGPDLLTSLQDLLKIRLPFYERCKATVSTDGKTVSEVAEVVAELARGVEEG